MPQFAGADVTLQPTSLAPIVLRFRPSWGLDARDGCYSVEGYAENAAGQSETVALASTPECVTVPEVTIGLALGVGVLWIVLGGVVGSRLGRHLKRNAKRYPFTEEA